MMIEILGTLAEFELSKIKERQREGIAKTKVKSVYSGRSFGSL
jgi:DNA invertase Pin-like site-specific DNA recombinase